MATMITTKHLNMKNISPFTKVTFLYLYGVLLHVAVSALIIYSSPADFTETIMGGKIRLYWGVLFGPVFMLFTVPSVIGVLMGILRGILRKGIKDMSILESALFLWLVADAVALIVGMVKGNSVRYVLSDTFILAIPPLSYFFVKKNIESIEQVRKFFYIILIIQLTVLLFPYTWLLPAPPMALTSGGLYMFAGAEAFTASSMMVFGLFSRNRWIFIGLFIAAIVAALSMVGIMYILQILIAMVLMIFIHISDKRFIRKFITMWLIVFISVFLLSKLDSFTRISEKINRAQNIVQTAYLNAVHPYSYKVKEHKVKEDKVKEDKVKEDKVKEDKVKEDKVKEDKALYTNKKWGIDGNGVYELDTAVKKVGEYSVKISGGANYYIIYQNITDYYKTYNFVGRQITFCVWVYTTIPNNTKICIMDYDGKMFDYACSPYHSGNGKWEFLSTSKKIRDMGHFVQLQVVNEHNVSGYFDGAVVADGELSVDELKQLVNQGNDMFEDFELVAARDTSLKQRVYEASVVKDALKSRPWFIPLGFGNGATINLSESPDVLTIRYVYGNRIKEIHFIHLLPPALLYRMGILGISVFIFLCIAIVVSFVKMKKYFGTLCKNAVITEILFLNIFMMLTASMLASAHFFIDITVGFGLGLIGAVRLNLFYSESDKNSL